MPLRTSHSSSYSVFSMLQIHVALQCMFQLMSLVGDLMKEMQKLKQENEQLKKDTQDLKASVSRFVSMYCKYKCLSMYS